MSRMDIRKFHRFGLKGQRTIGGRPRFRPRVSIRTRSMTRAQAIFPIVVRPKLELKFHDLDIDDTAVAIGATISQVTCVDINQGVGESERVGRKCTIRQINWRFNLTQISSSDQADPPKGDVVRVILYQDKQANKLTAATTDILETADYQSFNNLSNKSRFRTLMDRNYTLGMDLSQTDGTNTGAYPEINITDAFFKRVNIDIEYTGATGAITEITSNNIGVMILSKNGTTQFSSKMRLRFSDV